MAVNYLFASAFCTAISLLGLQWWMLSFLDGIKSDGLIGGEGIHSGKADRVLDLLLGSNLTKTLAANLVLNVFLLVIISLKTLFFVRLYPSEPRKVLTRIINYLIYKGTFLPLVVPPNIFQAVLWSTWLIILCSLKMFQSLARDRLERLNASPTATPSKYFRVFSALILVLCADCFWIRLCVMIYQSFKSSLFLLLFFEPLCIAFETLKAIMVHGFQLLDIWQHHSLDNSDGFGSHASNKSAAGSLSEWKGFLIRNCGFVLDIMTLIMALSHYLIIWWLHGMAFHVVDAILFLNLRGLVTAIVKRIRGYIKLTKDLCSLNGSLPDATYEELCEYDDECAICKGPMARAKKLACNHLFHLACLRSWLDQGLTEVNSCPTCRKPLCLPSSQNHTSFIAGQVSNNEQLAEQVNVGLDQQRISGQPLPIGTFPNQQQNPTDTLWRGVGYDSSWIPPWANPVSDGAGSSSSSIRSAGLSGVQMMMRQLASVGENYAHTSSLMDDAAWNFWAPTSSATNNPSFAGPTRNAAGLQFRNTAPPLVNAINITPHIRAMVDRVREVLPHIPNEVIIQDLMRTNNINITVNNLLLVE